MRHALTPFSLTLAVFLRWSPSNRSRVRPRTKRPFSSSSSWWSASQIHLRNNAKWFLGIRGLTLCKIMRNCTETRHHKLYLRILAVHSLSMQVWMEKKIPFRTRTLTPASHPEFVLCILYAFIPEQYFNSAVNLEWIMMVNIFHIVCMHILYAFFVHALFLSLCNDQAAVARIRALAINTMLYNLHDKLLPRKFSTNIYQLVFSAISAFRRPAEPRSAHIQMTCTIQ